MKGFAHGLSNCAIWVRDNEPVEARRLMTEKIHIPRTAIKQCDGGNFYLTQQLKAVESTLAAMYELIV